MKFCILDGEMIGYDVVIKIFGNFLNIIVNFFDWFEYIYILFNVYVIM